MFNDSVKLKWEGKEYDCPVTMDLVKRMERSGFNILQAAAELDRGGIPPVSMVAELYAFLLIEGGCTSVTDEDIYTSIMKDMEDAKSLVIAAKHAIGYFFPEIEPEERKEKSSGKK